jgi:hypothetical protein
MMFFNIVYNATRFPFGLSARRKHMEDSGTTINANSMSVRGHILDTVVDLTSTLHSMYLENGALDLKILAKMMQESLDIGSRILVTFQASRFKSFLTALCGYAPNSLRQIGKLDDEIAALETPFLLSVASETRGQWLLEHFPWPDGLNCVQEYLSNRCFGLTKSNRFSIQLSKSSKGDSIALIQGSVVPHVVRSTDDGSFLLIGECIAQGVMQGEITNEDNFQWDRITLV